MFNIFALNTKTTAISHFICSELDDLHLLVTMLENSPNVSSYTIIQWMDEYNINLWDVKKFVSFKECSKNV